MSNVIPFQRKTNTWFYPSCLPQTQEIPLDSLLPGCPPFDDLFPPPPKPAPLRPTWLGMMTFGTVTGACGMFIGYVMGVMI